MDRMKRSNLQTAYDFGIPAARYAYKGEGTASSLGMVFPLNAKPGYTIAMAMIIQSM